MAQSEILNKETDVKSFLSSVPIDSLDSLCVAVEPTGSYWYLMADAALSSGCRVVSAPPRAAKKFLQSVNLRAKTDKLDAKGLALYASTMELHDYQPKTKITKTLDELLSLRRNLSQNKTYYTQVAQSGRAGCDIASEILASIKTRLSDLDKRIAQAQSDIPQAKKLRTVPGFGPIVSAALASKLTSYSFAHSDSFVAYIGLDLKISDSGKKRGRRVLSKNGDPELRRLLYLAAQSSLRVKDSPFKKIYDSHRERGLSSTAALCAVARKLARTAWSIARFGTEYNPKRVFLDKKALKKISEPTVN
jgi:transposase